MLRRIFERRDHSKVPRIALRVWISALVILVVFAALLLSTRKQKIDDYNPFTPESEKEGKVEKSTWDSCKLSVASLAPYNLTESFDYSRRRIQAEKVDSTDRKILTLSPHPLIPASRSYKNVPEDVVDAQCDEALTLEVPSSPPTQAINLLFGIATNVERLRDSIPQLLHWLPHSGAGLLVVTPSQENDTAVDEVEAEMRKLGIDVTVEKATGTPFPLTYFSLVERLYVRRRPSTRWIGLIDDDTFFPSIPRLSARLASYDDKKPFFIAPVSEDMEQIKKHGIIAFGGGGIFLSMPLVENIHNVYPECAESDDWEGDQVLSHCIYHHTSTRLTIDYDLHQLDLRGDPSGFFESGREPLSIHHWKSWFIVNIPKLAAVGRICGPECLLQRWRFADNIILSNGYSIVEVREDIEFRPEYVEKTWEFEDWRFEHSLGPFRPALLEEDEKVTYLLEDSVPESNGIRQVYIHRGRDGRNDRVLELLWNR
ncbi:MAG: hypothetical protein M1819_002208 [Sarea resinae]|nr:MAG: hypothetical protein M1819_002208 [Sarea resinae]